MSKKLILFLVSFFILCSLFLIISFGVLPNPTKDQIQPKDISLYLYKGNDPEKINHDIISYLQKNDEERKETLKEDISKFVKAENEIQFYNLDTYEKFKKGSTITIFLLLEPYYSIKSGFILNINQLYGTKAERKKDHFFYSNQIKEQNGKVKPLIFKNNDFSFEFSKVDKFAHDITFLKITLLRDLEDDTEEKFKLNFSTYNLVGEKNIILNTKVNISD